MIVPTPAAATIAGASVTQSVAPAMARGYLADKELEPFGPPCCSGPQGRTPDACAAGAAARNGVTLAPVRVNSATHPVLDNPVLDPNGGPKRCLVLFGRVVEQRCRCSCFRPLHRVTVMDRCLPSAWNVSWNGALDDPSAASAFSAMTCVIGAASARGARSRTSCKRQVSGSIPLTGSQVRGGKYPLGVSGVERMLLTGAFWRNSDCRYGRWRRSRYAAPKSRRSARTPDPHGFSRAGADLILSDATAIREAPGYLMRQWVLAASIRAAVFRVA
jgi:hypothetical protein